MGERAEALAKQFEQANEELIRAVEHCSHAQWRALCTSEGWSVGVTAHHIAEGHKSLAGLASIVANGQPMPPLTMEMIHHGNAEHAKQHASTTQEDTLDLLRRSGTEAAAMVRALSDEQLDRSAQVFAGPTMSAEQIIERILIGHISSHLDSIRQASPA